MELHKLLARQLEKQSVGTLTLGRSKRFREIFFDRNALYLVGNEFSGKIAFPALVGLDSLWSKIDVPSLEALISSTDLQHHLLPAVLHEQGIVDDDELDLLAGAQIRDEIADLFTQSSDSFHFQEGRVPEFLLQFETINSRISVPIETALADLEQRTRLIAQYRSLIPSEEEVFVVTEKGMAYKQVHSDDYVLHHVLTMIDGFRDFSTVASASFLYEIVVLRCVFECLEQGFLKKTLHPELRGVSTTNITRADAERVLPHFKNAIKYGVDELAARERLAVIYERVGMIEDAVLQYNFIGDTLFQTRKPSKAVRAYQRALTLKPGEVLLTDKITKIYVGAANDELKAGNVEQAVNLFEGALKLRPDDPALADQLIQLLTRTRNLSHLSRLCDELAANARRTGTADAAVCFLEHTIAAQPDAVAHRTTLANLLLDFGREQEAAKQMGELAQIYLANGQREKGEELLSKIKRLNGSRSETRSLRRKLAQHGERRPRRRRRLAITTLLAVVVAYQAWSFVLWHNIQRHHGLAAFAFEPPAVDEAALLAELRPEEGSSLVVIPESREAWFQGLVRAYDEFVGSHPASLCALQAQRFRRWASGSAEALIEAREDRKKRDLHRIRKASAEHGDLTAVEATVARLRELPEDDPVRVEAESIVARLEHPSTLSAKALAAKAAALEESGQHAESFRAYAVLAERYPRSPEARAITLPVLVDSVPSGAFVFDRERGDNSPAIGRTPLALAIPIDSAKEIRLERAGFHPAENILVVATEQLRARSPLRRVHLERKIETSGDDRTVDLSDDPASSPPTIYDSWVYWGGDSGRLHRFHLESGNRSASQPVERGGVVIIDAPVITAASVITRWSDGFLRVWARTTGALRATPDQVHKPTRLISSNVLALRKPPLVLFGSDGRLEELTRGGIRPHFQHSSAMVPTILRARPENHGLLVGSSDGYVRAFNIGRRSFVEWAAPTGDRPVEILIESGETILAGDGSSLHVLRPGGDDANSYRRVGTIPAPSLLCVHQPSGTLVAWSGEHGLRALSLAGSVGAKPAFESLMPRLAPLFPPRGTVTRLDAVPDWIAVVRREPTARRHPGRSGVAKASPPQDHVLVFLDPKSRDVSWTVRIKGEVTYVTGTKEWTAIVTRERFTILRTFED